jgi:hypothetical protein
VDADKLVDHLDKLAAVRGFPRYLRCHNGPELISNALEAVVRIVTAFAWPAVVLVL